MSQIIEIPEAKTEIATEAKSEKADKKPRRYPRLADRILGGTPWLVAPHYRQSPEATKRFIANVRAELCNERTTVIACDTIAEFLRDQEARHPEEWDLTRDIPNAKPHNDLMFWEWINKEPEPLYTGVLVKGVIKRSLYDAIEEFTAIQSKTFDYDVAMVLDSAQRAEKAVEAADGQKVAMFLVGSVFQGTLFPVLGKRNKEFRIRTVGSFALTMNASGRPVPDSLALMTWDDDEGAKDPNAEADWSEAAMRQELLQATRRVLLMHTLTRAIECNVTTIEPAPFKGGRTGKAHARDFCSFNSVDLGTLPRKLVEEGFAAREGLKQALVYMAFKFAASPVEWRD